MTHFDNPLDAVKMLLSYICEDPRREGLRETPARVLRSLREMTSGYQEDPELLMKVFEDGACDELVVVKDIDVVSLCEHHLLPFTGVAHVGYLPAGRIIGLSKIARIVDIYARRLQVQERLTVQVTSALMKWLQPRGAACVIEAKHSCLSCRGAKKQNAVMVTSSLEGVFKEAELRAEFLSLIR